MTYDNLEITHHALNRFIERIDSGEPFPRTRIRQLLANAEEIVVRGGNIDDPALKAGNAVFVLDEDREAVTTCIEPREGQIAAQEDA